MAFTSRHQLSLAGKTGDFTRKDLKALAEYAGLTRGRDRRILDEVVAAFREVVPMAESLGVPPALVEHVRRTLRLSW